MPDYYDQARELRRHVDRLVGTCAASDVLDVVRRTRKVLESTKLKDRYRTISFYCDWYVHGEMDRHPRVWQILVDLDAGMLHDSSDNPVDAVNKLFRIEELRAEWQALFEDLGISARMFTQESNWQAFSGALFGELCKQPIRWPENLAANKQAKRAFDGMMRGRTTRPDIYPKALFVEHRLDGHEGRGLYWVVVLADTPHDVLCTGLLIRTQEPPAA